MERRQRIRYWLAVVSYSWLRYDGRAKKAACMEHGRLWKRNENPWDYLKLKYPHIWKSLSGRTKDRYNRLYRKWYNWQVMSPDTREKWNEPCDKPDPRTMPVGTRYFESEYG